METTFPLKHALMHTNLVMSNCRLPICPKSRSMTVMLHHIASVIIYCAKEGDLSNETITSMSKSITVDNVKLESLIKNSSIQDTNYIKWLKSSLSIPVSPEYLKYGMTTNPHLAEIRMMEASNLKGRKFSIYIGKETVDFKYKDMRGQFVHNGQNIINVTTNYTTQSDLCSLIAEIAVYCRYDTQLTTGKNLKQMSQEVREKFYKKPHLHPCMINTNSSPTLDLPLIFGGMKKS